MPTAKEQRELDQKAQDTFLSETLEESEQELEFEDDDEKENREHEDGDSTDQNAAANTADAEIAALEKGDTSEDDVAAGTELGAAPPPPSPAPEPAATSPAGEVPQEPATAQPTTEQQPPAGEQPAPAPAVGDGQQPLAQQPSEQPIPEVAAPSQEDIQQTYQTWRDQSERLLAEQYYALSPEIQAELELEPAKVIPRLMAKTYLDAMTASIGQMTMHFPRMVRLVQEQMETERETENQFFSRWPGLKEKKSDVQRFGEAWRKLNPSASAEQFINEVGAGVCIALRIDPNPQAQANGNGNAQLPAPPFVPGIGAPPISRGKQVDSDNLFTQFDREFEEELNEDS